MVFFKPKWLQVLQRLTRYFDGLLLGGEERRIAKAEFAVETFVRHG